MYILASMNFGKKQASFNLILGLLATCLLVVFRPIPQFDYDFENFFSQENDELSFYQEFRKTFENDNDYLLLALHNTPNVFDSAFLERSASIQTRIDSLENVVGTISLLNASEPIVSPFGIRMRPVLDWSSPAGLMDSELEIRQNESLSTVFLNRSADFHLIQIRNKQGISKEEGDELYGQILHILEESPVDSFHLAGKIRAQKEFVALMQDEFGFFLRFSFLLIAFVLWLLFRHWWTVVVPLLVLAIGIVWAIAFQLWMGKALDLMSVMLPTILAIVGLAGMIHFMNLYRNLTRSGLGKHSAIQQAFERLAFPVFLTALTTSLGFLTLYFTDVPVLKYFGLFTGIGVMFMFVAVVILCPGLFYLFPGFRSSAESAVRTHNRDSLHRALQFIFRFQKEVFLAFILITIVAVFAANQLKINGYILDSLPADSELMQEFKFFDREFGGSKPIEIHLEIGSGAKSIFDREVLLQVESVEAYVMENFGTSSLVSPVSVAKLMNKAQNGGSEKAYRIPSLGQLERMDPLLEKWREISPIGLYSQDRRQGRISGRSPDFGSYRSTEDKSKFDLFLKEHINENLLRVRLTGTSHLIDISHQNVTFQLAKGIGIAFLVVAIVVGILFGSRLLPFLVLIPNIIPLFWVAGVVWLIGAELSLSTAIIFAVAFGIAVDDTIHFMSKLQSEHRSGKTWLYALKSSYLETGKSLILSSVVLVSGFGILVFSQFGVTFYVGLLISLALIFALIADLLLLPTLLIFYHRVKKKGF